MHARMPMLTHTHTHTHTRTHTHTHTRTHMHARTHAHTHTHTHTHTYTHTHSFMHTYKLCIHSWRQWSAVSLWFTTSQNPIFVSGDAPEASPERHIPSRTSEANYSMDSFEQSYISERGEVVVLGDDADLLESPNSRPLNLDSDEGF